MADVPSSSSSSSSSSSTSTSLYNPLVRNGGGGGDGGGSDGDNDDDDDDDDDDDPEGGDGRVYDVDIVDCASSSLPPGGYAPAAVAAAASDAQGAERERKDRLLCVAVGVMSCLAAASGLLLLCLSSGGSGGGGSSQAEPDAPALFLVESIPLVNFSLQLAPGALPTYAVLTDMVRDARHTLDVSVMYWNLLAAEDDDYDDKVTAACGEYGCARGSELYDAMLDAVCERGVALRFLQDNSTTSLSSQEELQGLAQAAKAPDCRGSVVVRGWDAKAWYGGGM